MTEAGISVAVISFNTRDMLRACLGSLRQAGAGRVIVVDNASTDGSPDLVRDEFPEVILKQNQGNTGYGSAANQAIAGSTGEVVLLLNADTVLHTGALEAICQSFRTNARAGIVGPRLVNLDGSLQRSCFPDPTPGDIFLDTSGIGRLFRYVPGLKEQYLRTWDHDRARSVPWVLGAAIGIRREAFNSVGGFDEDFYMYYEEVDLCYRLRQAGWEVMYNPEAAIIHAGGASTAQRRAEMILQLYASLGRFYHKHYNRVRQVEYHLLILAVAQARLWRDRRMLHRAGDERSKARLGEDVQVWRRLSQLSREALGRFITKQHIYDAT
jgi:GT2 family glycosyltransferase